MTTPRFTDGKLHEKEFSVWPALQYPFDQNPDSPDVFARVFKRSFIFNPQRRLPRSALRTSYSNLFTTSYDFASANWAKSAATVTANVIANPYDGAMNASLLSEDTSNAYHSMRKTVLSLAVTPYCIWGIFKAGLRNFVAIDGRDSASSEGYAYFDLVNGLVTSTGGALYNDSSISTLGDGWWLCRVVFTPGATGTATQYVFTSNDGIGSSYIGLGPTYGVYCAHMQFQTGSVAGPLIFTTAGSGGRTVSVPDVDGLVNSSSRYAPDIFAFLTMEAAPSFQTARRGTVERTYARIPRQQIVPDVRFFTRPSLDGTKSGTAYAVGFFPDRDHIFTSARKAVTRVASTPASTIAAAMPGTNIVFTDSGAHVVNLPANSSAAAATAALAAGLTSLTGISCAAGTGWLNLVWTGTMASIVPPSGVYVAGIGGTHAELAASGNQTTPATTLFEVPSHGGIVGDRMAMWAGDALVGKATVVAVIDANNVSVMTSDLAAADSQVTHVAFSSDADLCVLNGPKTCSIRRVRDFYLIGYTEIVTYPLGIPTSNTLLTSAEIPGQDPAVDPVNWFAAIIAGTTWVNIDGSELNPYQGPILQREYAQVQLADAVQTVTP